MTNEPPSDRTSVQGARDRRRPRWRPATGLVTIVVVLALFALLLAALNRAGDEGLETGAGLGIDTQPGAVTQLW